MDYLDFEILVQPLGEAYRAEVIRSPGGEGSTQFSLPFYDGELQRFSWLAGRRWREPPLGLDGFLDWYEHTGRIPDDVDREDLRTLMDCYL